jgi:hypothetical protein
MRLETRNSERNFKRHLRAALSLVMAAVVVAGAAVGVDIVWNRYLRHSGNANAGFTCPTVIEARHASPLSRTGVQRITLIGDSIMYQASCTVAEHLADVGITTFRHAVPGSGLLTGSVDWVEQTRNLIALEHPNIVMAVFVGNYPTPIYDGNGQPIARASSAFFRAWQARAEALAAVVAAGHARMYWVSPPPIGVPILFFARQLFDGYRKIPGTSALDAGSVLAGPHGEVVTAKETCGRHTTIRTSDGVHLTFDGARIYGEQIAHDLTSSLMPIPTPQPC